MQRDRETHSTYTAQQRSLPPCSQPQSASESTPMPPETLKHSSNGWPKRYRQTTLWSLGSTKSVPGHRSA